MINFNLFKKDKNSWLLSSQNVKFSNNILECDLKDMHGNWIYNKIEISELTLNKNLINNNGKFQYELTEEDKHNYSWLESCQNIHFDNNFITCELKDTNRNWIYNKIETSKLLLNKKLINNNGKFDFELTNDERYSNNLYSIIDLNFLQDYIDKNIANKDKQNMIELFEIEKIINKTSQNNCFTCALFCQNVDNKKISIDHSLDYQDKNSKWYKKYYLSLLKFIQDFKRSKYYNNYKIRIYLEKQLDCFINELLSQCDHLEIYYMRSNSIGAQPGMLWRFLAFDDKDLDIVFCSDIDVDFNSHINNKLNTFSSNNKAFGRCIPPHNIDIRINKNDNNSPHNYTVCIGSSIAIRPKLLDVNIKDTIINYTLYRISRYTSNKPCEEFDFANTEKYNNPVGDHIYGWGGYWTMYGFDEKFWKHTIFPYLIKKGEVLTWIGHHNNVKSCNDNHPCKIDYNFTSSYNNIFVFI